MGVPTYGSAKIGQAKTSSAEELTQSPSAEVLGTLSSDKLNKSDSAGLAAWESTGGVQVEMTEPPPPWEVNPAGVRDNTDARRFVQCPENIELRWINPRLLDQFGWRDWQPVPARDSDKKFKLLNAALGRPDNTVRRGVGEGAAILAWMYRSWVKSREKQKAELVRRRTQASVDRQQQVSEEIARGNYGPYVKPAGSRHPTHTIGDGRSMRD